mmetsp:Transcript_74093/g.166339  ORF Transcript_74093/g.166339 Transcript_74093/m.166339 type:complete len:435 (-) Transcript_74093:28-1332(-)
MWGSGASGVGGTAKGAKRPSLFGLSRFDFCLTPRESFTIAPQPSPMGLCGRPLCSGMDQETELSVVHVPKCGGCNGNPQEDPLNSELNIGIDSALVPTTVQRNLHLAKTVIRDVFAELEAKCLEERCHYEDAGMTPPRQKVNAWATYTNKARLQRFAADSLEFLRQNADCRTRSLTVAQLRFLVLLQHFVSEDTNDFHRPEMLRKHQDAFEGVLTDAVNSQLVKDAHRSEFSVDGRSFCMQDLPHHGGAEGGQERVQAIARFQTEFITALEGFLLAFCSRKGLSTVDTKRLIQAVTTQMSQAGLANLDRGSQATRYFVGSNGLDQRTTYNLSTMHSTELGESLKLSILCMKTGFTQYLEKDALHRMSGDGGADCPKYCKPASYLYQYATLRFTPGGQQPDSFETTTCTVLDALDEAHIVPRVEPLSATAASGAL